MFYAELLRRMWKSVIIWTKEGEKMSSEYGPISVGKIMAIIGVIALLLASLFLYVAFTSKPHEPPPGTVYDARELQVYLDAIQRQQEKADTYWLMALISGTIGIILILLGLVPWPHEGINYKKKYDIEPVVDVNCHNCGAVIPSNSKICQGCGRILSLDVQKRSTYNNKTDVGTLCPYCNNIVRSGSKFCGRCGRKVDNE